MTERLPKRLSLRLDRAGYVELRLQILERDGWKCQHCGRRDRLQIHHLVRRSQSGPDTEDNLMTVCSDCHRELHLGRGFARAEGPPSPSPITCAPGTES